MYSKLILTIITVTLSLSLSPKIISSEAIVLGTPTYFERMNGCMTLFLERLWCLRHQKYPLEATPYAVVAAENLRYVEQCLLVHSVNGRHGFS